MYEKKIVYLKKKNSLILAYFGCILAYFGSILTEADFSYRKNAS